MSSAKKVLVTGAAGFVGRATVAGLRNAGYLVTEGVRSMGASVHSQSIQLDLSNPGTLLTNAGKVCFDAVVHLGACVGLDTETEADLFTENVLATGCLAYLSRQWGAHLVFASTAIVHGAKTQYIEANSPLLQDTPYARTKWLGEELIKSSGSQSCILRIGGVFGFNGPSHLGLNRAIVAASKGELPLQIGLGNTLRNYIFVHDVAYAITQALQKEIVGTHLLAGSEIISVGEMLQIVCDTFCQGSLPRLSGDGSAAVSATNQIIKTSDQLPLSRSFREAIMAIREQVHT